MFFKAIILALAATTITAARAGAPILTTTTMFTIQDAVGADVATARRRAKPAVAA